MDSSLSRTFISIDMDAFYCGVEQKLDPSLVGEPFIVVQKQCAATVSYAARDMGIRKLDSIFDIKKKFPNIRVANGESLAKYRAAGLEIFTLLTELFPNIERLGLEEFRFEITQELNQALKPLKRIFKLDSIPDDLDGIPYCLTEEIECSDFFFSFDGKTIPSGRNSFGSEIPPHMYLAGHFAQYLKEKIKLKLGLNCSIGVASSKNYAKIACSFNKPAGVTVVLPGYEPELLKDLPVAKVPGMGFATQRTLLDEFQIGPTDTVGELHAKINREQFTRHFDMKLWDLTVGIDNSDIIPWFGPAQISKEDTFSPKISPAKCMATIQMLATSLIAQANEEVVFEGKWTQKPIKFRVSSSPENIRSTSRKSKTIPLTLRDEIAPKELEKFIARNGYSMLQEISKEHIRVLNIAFIFKT